jgi:16S rRNA (cytosine967-C5)-methyltransferase
LRWLSRVPARAAINESVELVKRARKRSAAPFVNAVLRKLVAGLSPGADAAPPAIDGDSAETLAASSAHPLWLVERWTRAYGLEAARDICRHDQSVPVTAIRLRQPEAEERLRSEGIELAPGAFSRLPARFDAETLREQPLSEKACVLFRTKLRSSSQLLWGKAARMLDCCAAPGGKTLAMADRNLDADVVAVELHLHRARLLRRLVRVHDASLAAGVSRINVVAADARNLPFAGTFDRVLADVPCSGTGTLSRNPEIKWRLVA